MALKRIVPANVNVPWWVQFFMLNLVCVGGLTSVIALFAPEHLPLFTKKVFLSDTAIVQAGINCNGWAVRNLALVLINLAVATLFLENVLRGRRRVRAVSGRRD